MRCTHCAHLETKVYKVARLAEGTFEHGTLKRRERLCKSCNKRFFTFEIDEVQYRKLVGLTEATPVRRQLLTSTKKKAPRLRETHL